MRLRTKITAIIGGAAVAASAAGFALSAGASSSESADARATLAAASALAATPPPARIGCVSSPDRTLNNVFENTGGFTGCPKGFPVSLATGGAQGPKGDAGATGATGAAGPSGVTDISKTPLTATADVPTGGSFNSKAVEVGSVDLAAGTYMVGLKAQVEPNADTASAVNAQFFLYDQPKNAAFSGDLLNVGTDVAPAGTSHDSYASGYALVTVPAGGETLIVYGFGYDGDSGASDYSLIAGPSSEIDVIGLTPAS